MPTYDYIGKVILVTGAASGIGAATASAFAKAGATVVLWDVNEVGLAEITASLPGKGHRASVVDVGDTEQVDAAFEALRATYDRLDFAHNNAGVELRRALLADLDEEAFDRSLRVNLKSFWLCMRREIPWMLENGGGAIVNTASVTSVVSVPYVGAYSTAKHGVLGLTRGAALEYADRNIRINAVLPGATRTGLLARRLQEHPELENQYAEKHPVGRIAEAEEVAAAVLWLCSEDAAFVVGHGMRVDGGWTLS